MSNYGALFASVTAIMFASFGIIAKFLYTYGLTSNMIFLLSSLFSVIILFCSLLYKNKNLKFLKIKREEFLLSFIGAGLVGLFLTNIFVLRALQYIGIGLQKAITYSNPIFTMLVYRFFFKKKLSPNEKVGLILMIIGLILTVGNAKTEAKLFYGVTFSLLAAFFSSTHSMITETYRTNLNVTLYWFYAFLGASLFALVAMLLGRENINIFIVFSDVRLLSLIFLCATLNFVLPYLSFFKAVTTIGAMRTGIIMTIAPALTAILGVLVFKEKITTLQIIGITGIISASLVSALGKNKTPPEGLKVGI
ncbi:MAG: DMT family transporter [Rickettsiales bacterium]|jgi:drug/metabolite transporter (DMT)-like permease|nr:DMT family transporter [Rickettsiales bacterium]